MPLTAKEMAQLAKLKAKADIQPEPLTEADLDAMESKVHDALGASALEDLGEFWNRWCARYHDLINDNTALINEVRRLRAERDDD